MTVFPDPKGPGIPAVPPLARGKRKSRILCPVMRGTSGAYFCTNGRGCLTGHSCIIAISDPSSSLHTVWVILNEPDSMVFTTPSFPGGTMTLCSIVSVSWTVPITCPADNSSPTLTVGTNSHSLVRSSPSASTPLVMKTPIVSSSLGRGL